jgi:hypothetical protein
MPPEECGGLICYGRGSDLTLTGARPAEAHGFEAHLTTPSGVRSYFICPIGCFAGA